MMPCEGLSGSDEAPTIAMTVASVSSCLSSWSLGFAWAILRAYTEWSAKPVGERDERRTRLKVSDYISPPQGAEKDGEHRRERRELAEPEQQRPTQHVGAEAVHFVADACQSFGNRDAQCRVAGDDVLAQARLQIG